jgi:glycosyltransferase involved in cell wall biosynthesis
MNDFPLVSIICTAYNHELFIKDALDGFVMQKTTFPFEIIISDDASSDSTVSIINQYRLKYPQPFLIFCHQENQFSKGTSFILDELIANAKGKYIALCEGDDYWTDPYKLQKQVDFLENNMEYSISFHQSRILNNGVFSDDLIGVETDLDWHDIFSCVYIPTQTVVFRNIIKKSPLEFMKQINGDTFLFCLLAQFGRAKYLNNIEPSVYRIHNSGIWSSKSLKEKYFTSLNSMIVYHKYFKGKYREPLVNRIIEMNREVSDHLSMPDFIHYSARTLVFINSNLYLNKNIILFKIISIRILARLKKCLFQ